MNKLPIILDDLIEKELQDKIEDAMFDCFWTYATDNVSGSVIAGMNYRKFLSPFEYDITPSFIANIESPVNKIIYSRISSIIKKGCDKINFRIEKVERFYGAIHAMIGNNSSHNKIHVNRGVPHLVMLYYVNDCDGDTILYDKTLDDIPYNSIDGYVDDFYELNIEHRISPKKGRILFFDGRVYHAPSTPTKSNRCILTLDLFGEFIDGSYKFPTPNENRTKNLFNYV